jgi:hypothetical protein
MSLSEQANRRRILHVTPGLSADRHRQRTARHAELRREIRDPSARERLIAREHPCERDVGR